MLSVRMQRALLAGFIVGAMVATVNYMLGDDR